MTRNQDVMGARVIHRALKPAGILVFDNFEASRIFTNFQERVRQEVRRRDRRFVRVSELSRNLATGWTWNWDATYVVDGGGKETKVSRSECTAGVYAGRAEALSGAGRVRHAADQPGGRRHFHGGAESGLSPLNLLISLDDYEISNPPVDGYRRGFERSKCTDSERRV